MQLQKLYHSRPNWRHLLWALPLSVAVLLLVFSFEDSLWTNGGFHRLGKAENLSFYYSALPIYIGSGAVAAIPILGANWSRTIWPRLSLAVLLLLAQVAAGSLFTS